MASKSLGADLEQLISEAEHYYGQAYQRRVAMQQEDADLPDLNHASAFPEQVRVGSGTRVCGRAPLWVYTGWSNRRDREREGLGTVSWHSIHQCYAEEGDH